MEPVTSVSSSFSPYVGLQPFNEADQDYFFGRERDSRIISSNLYAAPLTILHGASGAGKSSVLRAGVIPLLRTSLRTAVVIFDGWSDKAPLNTLKVRCMEAFAAARTGKTVQVDIHLPLDEFLFSATRAFGGTLLIIFDQFEEYFLYHPETEKDNTFDSEFARAVNREEIDANFLISLREDALSKLYRFRARIPNMQSNGLQLRHLNADSARDAIRKPLDVYGKKFPAEPHPTIENELVEELIQDLQVEKLVLGPGGQGKTESASTAESDVRIEAPFLQLVLTQLWNEEKRLGSSVLRLATLRSLGGAGTIVRTHMDRVMDTLTAEEQETAADIFRYLVTPSGTKIAYSISDLEYYAKSNRPLQPVMEKLAQGDVRIMRSVTTPDDSSTLRYEIYHDVLAPAILDWRTRYERSKQLLDLFSVLVEKGDNDRALKIYEEVVQRTPQMAFFPARYQIRKIMGQGDLGVRYCIFDQQENRLLSATILEGSQAFEVEKVAQFVDRVGKLSSPRISRLLGFGRHHDNIYLLSEYIDAPPLHQLLRQGKPLPYRQAMQVAEQVAEALEDGHRQGTPHLNLLPFNIVLDSTGAKLENYAFSQLSPQDRSSNILEIDNSYDYQSPEQLAGAVGDERSDIYALGTILYLMLTGHPPSIGSFQNPSETSVEVTEAVDVLIDHARQREPDKRYATASEMRVEIGRILRVSFERGLNQFLRVGLAWASNLYENITSRKWLGFLLTGLFLLLLPSIIYTEPKYIWGTARVTLPLIFNSLLISTLFDWLIRVNARRQGLGSLITTGRGMGAILGLMFTLNLIRLGFHGILISKEMVSVYLTLLTLTLFATAISWVVILSVAWVIGHFFKSYTTGFYWSFIAIVLLEVILTILKLPPGIFEP